MNLSYTLNKKGTGDLEKLKDQAKSRMKATET